MINVPDDLRYTKEHEWVRRDAGVLYLGITDFAQRELGDIIFVELPSAGAVLKSGKSFATIEAVKTVADIFAPLDGEVASVNAALSDNAGTMNSDPYGKGWVITIKPNHEDDLNALLTADQYKKLISA